MKKGLILLLCLLLLLTPALVACGEPDEVSGEAVSSTPPGDVSEAGTENAKTSEPENTVAASALLAAAEAAFEDLPPHAVYSFDGTPADSMLLINMFTGNMEFDEEYNILPPAEFTGDGEVRDYAIHTPSGKTAVEIVILVAKSAADVPAVRALCQ